MARVIDLDVTRARIEECDRRIERLLSIMQRGAEVLDQLDEQRIVLRAEVRALNRQLKENPEDAIAQSLLKLAQLQRASVRRIYRGWCETLSRSRSTVELSDNMRRNLNRKLIEWS